MFEVKIDPRTKTASGICTRDEHTIFDSWIYDRRRRGYGIHNHMAVTTKMPFFRSGAPDPRRCNHLTPGRFPDDITFITTKLGLHISFSNLDIETAFIRSSVLQFDVGDRPMYQLHGQLLAQPSPFVQRLEDSDPAKSGLLLWVDLDAHIATPPRQGFNIVLEMLPPLKEMLVGLQNSRHSFGMIKVMMKGYRIRKIFKDELTDEDHVKLTKRHEEMIRQQEEKREQATLRAINDEKRFNENMASLLSTFAQGDTVIRSEHIAKAEMIKRAVNEVVCAIVDGGHFGVVPTLESLEFGVVGVDELEANERVRDFNDKPQPMLFLDALQEAAWKIAKERVLDDKPLDESYRQDVASAIGINDFYSAIGPEGFVPTV